MLKLSPDQFESLSKSVFAFSGIVDDSGEIISITGSGLNDEELEAKDLAGENFLDLKIWQSDSTNEKSLSDSFKKAIKGESTNTRLKYITGKKTLHHIELTLLPDLSGDKKVFFGAKDVSQYQLEIDVYKDRCDQFLFAAEGANIGLWYLGFKSDEVFSTPTCNELFGFPKDETLRFQDILDRIHREDKNDVIGKLDETRNSETEFSLKFRIVHSDGNIIWVSLRGKTFFSQDGNPKGMVGCVQNINEEKAVSEQLESIYKLEKEARHDAEVAIKTKDFFLAVVSHELRSPLNSILGWTNILLTDDLDKETQKKALHTIKNNSESQAKLIEDLIDSARITSGKLTLDLAPVNLSYVLQEVVNAHLPAMEEKVIKFEFENDLEEAQIYGDAMRLKQVFSNLVGNAAKFTPEGGDISLGLLRKEGDFIVTIKDSGIGISEEDLPFIFQRFMQGESGAVRKSKGLGLGLSLARILVEKHNGVISAESEGIDQGSEFTVVLPAFSDEAVMNMDGEIEDEPIVESTSQVLEGVTIFVVEDDEDSRNVLEIFLEQLGAKSSSAESVKAALTWLTDSENPKPDIIISDIGMPDEDGYSFARKLRASEELKDIPAIALSAFTAEKNKTEAYEAGFQKYHTKPFLPELLSEEILALVFPPGE